MASFVYTRYILETVKDNTFDLSSAGLTVKIALVTASYAANQQNDEFFDDVTNEVSSAGYTAGGETLASKTVTRTTTVVAFDAANPTWSGVTFTYRAAVVYQSTGTASTSRLICYIDFGSDIVVSAGDVEIQFDAAGIFEITT